MLRKRLPGLHSEIGERRGGGGEEVLYSEHGSRISHEMNEDYFHLHTDSTTLSR